MELAEQLLTPDDMMKLLRVSRRTLDAYLAGSKLPRCFKLGRRIYWHRDVVECWLRDIAELDEDERATGLRPRS